ncbi:hypothetical protein LTR49_013827 [Elasticomyces elasticus]|nr:hypothetical protein LTR49_013827 [Elasticomyces elasticus]
MEDSHDPPAMERVETALRRLQINSGDTGALPTLAAASKEYPEVRAQLATPEILKTLLEAAEAGLSDSLETTVAALRCVGNACIDDDVARSAVAANGFSWAILCLNSDDDEIRWLTVKVLYNICSDHETAQQQCYHDRVYLPLITICTSPLVLHSEDTTTLIDLLFWITGHKAALPGNNLTPMSDDDILKLLMLPYYNLGTTTVEDFATLVEISLTFLRDSAVQDRIVKAQRVAYVWQMYVDCENRVSDENGTEYKELLKPLSTSLMWCLSDMAAHEAFDQHYSLDSGFIDGLLFIIESGGEERGPLLEDVFEQQGLGDQLLREARTTRQIDADEDFGPVSARDCAAACQIVGNLVRVSPADDVSLLVLERGIHKKLWDMVANGGLMGDDDVLHSIAGFLIQLTRPSIKVRERVGYDDQWAEEALKMLCLHATPEIRQVGIRLLRALGKDCPLNQQHFRSIVARAAAQNDIGADSPMQIEAAPA